MSVAIITYGEAKIYAKRNFVIKKGLAIFPTVEHFPRMRHKETIIYYSQKITRIWIRCEI